MPFSVDSLSTALAGLNLKRESGRASSSLLVDEAPIELFRRLCTELEARYPRDEAGEAAFSEYAAAGWSSEAYSLEGFARKYVSKKFEARCLGAYEFMIELRRHYMLELSGAEIADMGAGPGCGAAGVAKFLADTRRHKAEFKSPKTTLLDPVSVWQEAASELQKIGIDASWHAAPSLAEMLSVECLRDEENPIIIVASHVLRDFGGTPAEMQRWWRKLGRSLSGRRAIVLIMEGRPCSTLAPERIRGGAAIHEFDTRMPHGTDNASHGIALLLPEGAWEKREAPPAPLSTPTRKATGPPQCPDCGGVMSLRVNRKGYNPGSKFWGCTGFPDCNGTRRV